MPDYKGFKKGLMGTTALIGAALSICSGSAARAGTVSTARALTYNMGAGEVLTVTNAGSITSLPAVSVNGVTADTLNNQGTLTHDPCSGCNVIEITNADLTGGITNSGTISAIGTAGAIYLSNSDISGGITNTGSITGSVSLYLSGDSSISGDILNQGTMKKMQVWGVISGDITNDTGATISGDIGIEVWGATGDISGDIINLGDINTGGTTGIYVRNGGDISGTIFNRSTGTISGNYGVRLQNAGSDISGGIVNEGVLEGDTRAVYVVNSTDISGGINNSGTIQVTGMTSSNNVILVEGQISGGITNTGTIDGTNAASAAIYLDGLDGVTPININGGRIIGSVVDSASGTGRSPVTVGGTFTSEGSFTVSSFDVNADGVFTFGNGHTLNSVAAVGNTGTMKVLAGETGNVTNDLTNAASGTLNLAGTLTVGGTFTNAGTLAVDAGESAKVTNAITNNGEVTVGEGATLTAGSFAGNGTYTIRLIDDGDDVLNAADFGSLASAGAIDLAGESVSFDFGGYVATGANVVLGTGGAPAVDAGTVTDNSLLYDAVLSSNGNNHELDVIEAATIDSVVGAGNKGIATALESIRDLGTNDSTLQSVLGSLTKASTAAEVDEVVSAMARPLNGDRRIGSDTVSGQTVTIAMQRLSAIRGSDAGGTPIAAADRSGESGMAAGEAYCLEVPQAYKHVWGQAFGQVAQQDERQGFSGYDSHTYGAVFGADTKELYDDITLGVAVSYGRTDVDAENANNIQTEADTYQFSVYGDYKVNDTVRVDGIIGFSWSDVEMDVYDIGGVPGVNAHGEFAAQQYSLQLGVSKDYPLANGMTLTPGGLMHYVYYYADNYQETGAGGANQIVESTEMQAFELGAELEASAVYRLQGCAEEYLRMNAVAGVRHDLIGDKMETTAQLSGGGGSFKTYGFEPAQTTYNAGIGFKRYSVGSNWEFTGKYDYEFKEDFQAHSASLRAGYRF